MYINKLHLRAFGKFTYKRLYFENKFNIVYGENEAGKSTVHNFIESMLYGFGSDDTDALRFNKYRPWNSNLYKGSLGIRDAGGEKHIISRDFALGTTQVLKRAEDDNELYEEEITNPGEYFFNMSKIFFNNTVSIRQLGNKTEDEMADEIKNKIINLSKTRDESISMDRIIRRLGSIKDEAGNESDDKTLLGQYALRLSELKEARENSVKACRQTVFLAMEKKKINGKIQELSLRIEELNKELADYDLSLKRDMFLRAEPVKKELDAINEKLLIYPAEKLREYSPEDYREAMDIESALNLMYLQRKKLEEEKADNEEELNRLMSDISNKINEEFSIDILNGNYRKYKNNIVKIEELKIKIQAGKENLSGTNIAEIEGCLEKFEKIEDISRKIELTDVFLNNGNYEKMRSYKRFKSWGLFFMVLLASSVISALWYSVYKYGNIIKSFIDSYYVMDESVNIAAGVVTALIVMLSVIFAGPVLNKIKSAKNEIDAIECETADNTVSLNRLHSDRQDIVSDAGCESLEEAVEKCGEMRTEKSMHEEKVKLIKYDEEALSTLKSENASLENNLRECLSIFGMDIISDENIREINDAYLRKNKVSSQLSAISDRIEQENQSLVKLNKEISFEEKRFEMILSGNGMEDMESFKSAAQYRSMYTELTSDRDYKQEILYKIIGDESFDNLKSRVESADCSEIKKIDRQEHQLSIFKLSEEKSGLEKNTDDILGEIDEIEGSTRSLVEIDEEIDFYENKINTFKRKIRVAEIAAEKILSISDSIKGDFMPLLRRSISDNFAYLTAGKYSQVL
ncbi:MAG TPA: hypothetical protein DC038_10140, partial [Clostridiales bacterium]|nr:hypothetical protein [Clostridiales bacterium]